MDDIRHSIPAGSKRFVHRVRIDLRNKGYSYQTEKTYIHWIKRFIRFHKNQHPETMDAEHIDQFLSFLGNDQHCSPATQRIALNALVYLYRKFLQRELEALNYERARQKRRLPVVLSHSEVNHLCYAYMMRRNAVQLAKLSDEEEYYEPIDNEDYNATGY